MKKRLLACTLVLTMMASMLAGCGSKEEEAQPEASKEPAAEQTQAPADADAADAADGAKFDKDVTLTFWSRCV